MANTPSSTSETVEQKKQKVKIEDIDVYSYFCL